MRVKTLDIQKYNMEYVKNNKERLMKTKQCEICGGKYSICSKTMHLSTKYHKFAEENINKYKNKISELETEIGKLNDVIFSLNSEIKLYHLDPEDIEEPKANDDIESSDSEQIPEDI